MSTDEDYDYDCTPDGYEEVVRFRGGSVWSDGRGIVVLASPYTSDESHNCDAMGCGQDHVVYRAALAPHAPPAAEAPPPAEPEEPRWSHSAIPSDPADEDDWICGCGAEFPRREAAAAAAIACLG